MKIIDLSLPIYTGMPVYHGDPEASIELVQSLEKNGWNMRRIEINSHDGTHVNVPLHGIARGKDLDDYSLNHFYGKAVIYNPSLAISSDMGVIFRDQNINQEIADKIKNIRPRFVGLSSAYEFDEAIEKDLLKDGLILYEGLCNLDLVPDTFEFYGMPLKIRNGDGSPIRAFAVIN